MPALLEYVRDEPLPDREEILARLGSHDRDVVLRIAALDAHTMTCERRHE